MTRQLRTHISIAIFTLMLGGCALPEEPPETGRMGVGLTNEDQPADVDGDGTVSVTDAVLLLELLGDADQAPLHTLPLDTNAAYPDVDGDGTLSREDVWAVSAALSTTPGELEMRARGDVDGDGCVDFGDYLVLSANFGTEVADGPASGDLDANGEVEFNDFLALSEAFGSCFELPAEAPFRTRRELVAQRTWGPTEALAARGLELTEEFAQAADEGEDILATDDADGPVLYANGSMYVPEASRSALSARVSRLRGTLAQTTVDAFVATVEEGQWDGDDNRISDVEADFYFASYQREFTDEEVRGFFRERLGALERRGSGTSEETTEPSLCIVECRVGWRREPHRVAPVGARDLSQSIESVDDEGDHCSGGTNAYLGYTSAQCDTDYEYDHRRDVFIRAGEGTMRAGVGLAELGGQTCDEAAEAVLNCTAAELAPNGCDGLPLLARGVDRVRLQVRAAAQRDQAPQHAYGRHRNNATALAFAGATSSAFGPGPGVELSADEEAELMRLEREGRVHPVREWEGFTLQATADVQDSLPAELQLGDIFCGWRAGFGMTTSGPSANAGIVCGQNVTVTRTSDDEQNVPMLLDYSSTPSDHRFPVGDWDFAMRTSSDSLDRRGRIAHRNIILSLGEVRSSAGTAAYAQSEAGTMSIPARYPATTPTTSPYKIGGKAEAWVRSALGGVHVSGLRLASGSGVGTRLLGSGRSVLDCSRAGAHRVEILRP